MKAGMMEVWEAIEGFPHYQVSNLGRVKSTWHRRISHDLILKPSVINSGYEVVRLCMGGHHYKQVLVHTLVAMAFLPRPAWATCVTHKNNNKLDSRASNLEWLDVSQRNLKARDRVGMGRQKLDISQVLAIKDEVVEGCSKTFLAKKYEVSRGLIGHIKRERSWHKQYIPSSVSEDSQFMEGGK